jgi:hypothetical protein
MVADVTDLQKHFVCVWGGGVPRVFQQELYAGLSACTAVVKAAASGGKYAACVQLVFSRGMMRRAKG